MCRIPTEDPCSHQCVSGSVQVDYLQYTEMVRHPQATVPATSAPALRNTSGGSGGGPPPPRSRCAGLDPGASADATQPGRDALRVAQSSDVRAVSAAIRTAVAWQEEEEQAAWVERLEAAAAARGMGLVKKRGKARGAGPAGKGQRGRRGGAGAAAAGRNSRPAPQAESSGTSQAAQTETPEVSQESLLFDEVWLLSARSTYFAGLQAIGWELP